MKELHVRKANRLRNYDYSQNGAYFVTICVKGRHELLGTIDVGDGVLDVPCIQLSEYGNITKKHIDAIGCHYGHVAIQESIIMPNHIHMIISINRENGTSRTPSPTQNRANATLPSLISTLKRFVHSECGSSLFQRSYHDHIIRNDDEYLRIAEYIKNNPATWQEDCFCRK